MVDPKELRIGAHVEYDGERYYVSIIATFGNLKDCVTLKNIYRTIASADCDKIQPIPLSPELLTELGFELDYGGFWFNDFLEIEQDKEWWSVNCGGKYFAVQYLHQLENLVYQTTKNELIK